MKWCLGGLVALGLLVDGGAVQADYVYTTLDASAPGLGALNGTTQAFGINNAGQVVGSYLQRNGNAAVTEEGFLFSSGAYSRIQVATYPANNWATGINDAGMIVGYTNQPGHYVGFSLNQGTYTTLAVPNSLFTQVFGINATGQIVGSFGDTNFATTHGFLLSSGNYTTLNAPGSQSTNAVGINVSSQIVGYSLMGTAGTTDSCSMAAITPRSTCLVRYRRKLLESVV